MFIIFQNLEYSIIIMRSLHGMHMGLVMSVCMIQLENCWTDLDQIWYGCYAIGEYPETVLYNFFQLVIPTWQMNKLVRWV
jgi:hypothetical protein